MKASVTIAPPHVDITAPDHGVEVSISRDGRILWVNVDGICALRVCQIPSLTVDDPYTNEITE